MFISNIAYRWPDVPSTWESLEAWVSSASFNERYHHIASYDSCPITAVKAYSISEALEKLKHFNTSLLPEGAEVYLVVYIDKVNGDEIQVASMQPEFFVQPFIPDSVLIDKVRVPIELNTIPLTSFKVIYETSLSGDIPNLEIRYKGNVSSYKAVVMAEITQSNVEIVELTNTDEAFYVVGVKGSHKIFLGLNPDSLVYDVLTLDEEHVVDYGAFLLDDDFDKNMSAILSKVEK